jgi:hypothetical protein
MAIIATGSKTIIDLSDGKACPCILAQTSRARKSTT